jgi:hypothetical protein
MHAAFSDALHQHRHQQLPEPATVVVFSNAGTIVVRQCGASRLASMNRAVRGYAGMGESRLPAEDDKMPGLARRARR